MKLVFLGTGGGIGTDFGNFQSNMVLSTDSGKKLLIDCGTDIRFSLTQAGFLSQDIDAVYISHLHADHVGGLEWFGFQRKFMCQKEVPQLIIQEHLVKMLWNNSLSGGMRTLDEKEANLNDYFKVESVQDDQVFEWEGLQLNIVKTTHMFSNKKQMPSYGLDIRYKGKSYFITTDTRFTPDYFAPYYKNASIIFHDCETTKNPSGVHAHFTELTTLSPEIKAKLWLYHYNDGELPDALAQGFAGFVRCRQEFELS